MSVGSQEDEWLEEFYQRTSNLFFNKEAIEHLIAEPTFETLMNVLH